MKRSSQVTLLLMGVGGVGAGAYALAPPRQCGPQDGTPPAAIAPAVPGAKAAEPCPPRRSWTWRTGSYRSTGSGTSSSHWYSPIFGRTSTVSTSRSTSRSTTRSSTTSRGGFGSTGRSISRSSSG